MSSPWSLAVGNLSSKPAPAIPVAAPVTPKPRAPATPTFCPCCGHRVASPDGPKQWSPDEDARLLVLLSAGKPYKVIAAELGRPLTSIKSRIATKGLRYPF